MKNRIGDILLWISMLVTTFFWLFSKSSLNNERIYLLLAQFSGVIGANLFLLGFILSSRHKLIENIFGGLDRVYRVHHTVGIWSYTLLLLHPIFLFLNVSNLKVFPTYFLPTTNFPYTLGVLAIYLLTLHIVTTVFMKLPYDIWKKIHKLISIPLLISLFHVLVINSDVSRSLQLRLWILFLYLCAILAYIYKNFSNSISFKKYEYKVTKVETLENITRLCLSPIGRKLVYKPGQFAYLSFKSSTISDEEHPFSMTSTMNDSELEFCIKNLGDFTSNISKVNVGDKVQIKGPYGFFGKEIVNDDNLVFIAAGIGITPFLSLAKYILAGNLTGKLRKFMYVTNSSIPEFILNIFSLLNQRGIPIFVHNTKSNGHFNIEEIVKGIVDLQATNYYICTPKTMLFNIVEYLEKLGVNTKNIKYELFEIK